MPFETDFSCFTQRCWWVRHLFYSLSSIKIKAYVLKDSEILWHFRIFAFFKKKIVTTTFVLASHGLQNSLCLSAKCMPMLFIRAPTQTCYFGWPRFAESQHNAWNMPAVSPSLCCRHWWRSDTLTRVFWLHIMRSRCAQSREFSNLQTQWDSFQVRFLFFLKQWNRLLFQLFLKYQARIRG